MKRTIERSLQSDFIEAQAQQLHVYTCPAGVHQGGILSAVGLLFEAAPNLNYTA